MDHCVSFGSVDCKVPGEVYRATSINHLVTRRLSSSEWLTAGAVYLPPPKCHDAHLKLTRDVNQTQTLNFRRLKLKLFVRNCRNIFSGIGNAAFIVLSPQWHRNDFFNDFF